MFARTRRTLGSLFGGLLLGSGERSQMAASVEFAETTDEASQTEDDFEQQQIQRYFQRWARCVFRIFFGCCISILTLEYMIK